MARIGTISEGDEEEDANKSSVLSGAILYDSEGVYLRLAIASRSFTMLPNFVTDSSSGLLLDDISTAPSTETTAPMAVAGSREGSPSPSIVAQLARRSILVAELFQIRMSSSQPPVPDQPATQSSRSGWASFKSNMRKQFTAGLWPRQMYNSKYSAG
jgi:hypothetical protein